MEPSWHHFGDHVDLLGRSVTLSWLSWHVLGHNFDSLDVQTKKIATILASHLRVLPFILHISLAKCTSPLHWSTVPFMCISSAPFSLTSYAQLAFGTSHPLVCACHLHLRLLTLTCPSDVHLLQHVDPQSAKSSCSSSAFCMQQFGCSTLSLRIQGFLCLLSVFLNSA